MDSGVCIQLLGSVGAVIAMWLRLEHRLSRVEGRVQERYRDKKATEDRIEKVEKWLPKDKPSG